MNLKQLYHLNMNRSLIRVLSLLTFTICLAVAYGQQEVYSKAKIFYTSQQQLQQLGQQGVALDHCHHKRGRFVLSEFSASELDIARNMGLQVEILIPDYKEYYLDLNRQGVGLLPTQSRNANCSSSGGSGYQLPANYNQGSMGGFLTYQQVLDELDDMAAQFPNLITARQPISTFQTVEGRPIEWLKISDNPGIDEPEPEMLQNSIHHAREPASVMQLIHFMWYLLENYGTDDEITAIVDNTELYFVPIVNPDGYVYNETTDPNGGGFWRKNRRPHGNGDFGVDLNRNYDYIDDNGNSVWGTTGVSFNTGSDVYPGTAPFTEPETQAMQWFEAQHDFIQTFDNHTFGDLLLFPLGYLPIQTPEHDIFVAHSNLLTSENGFFPQVAGDFSPAAGAGDDFHYGQGSSSYTPEIGYAFWPQQADIDAISQSTLFMNITAAHLITNYAVATSTDPSQITNVSGSFHYDIQRLGFSGPGDFTVIIDPISSNILSVGGANVHTGMTMLQMLADSITYTLDPAIVDGDIVRYALTIDGGIYTFRDTIQRTFGQPMIALLDQGDNLNNWAPGTDSYQHCRFSFWELLLRGEQYNRIR